MKEDAVYTGKETSLIGLHAKVIRCKGLGVYCRDPECTKVFATFDDPEMPTEHKWQRDLTIGATVFEAADFAIADRESPLAPQNGV